MGQAKSPNCSPLVENLGGGGQPSFLQPVAQGAELSDSEGSLREGALKALTILKYFTGLREALYRLTKEWW